MSRPTTTKRLINLILPSIIGLAVLITIATNWHWLKAYYSNMVHNDFKLGDRLYATPNMFGKNKQNIITLYRFVRPLNANEIQ